MLNLTDYYWIVAGDATQVYSSHRRAFVATNDATYVAWLAQGWLPSQIDTMDNLTAILSVWLPA